MGGVGQGEMILYYNLKKLKKLNIILCSLIDGNNSKERPKLFACQREPCHSNHLQESIKVNGIWG